MYSSNSTPVTTPSSTSSSNITPKVRIFQMVNDMSPLFSKEQQAIIKRTRGQLEIEIAALRKRKQILVDQLAHIRSDFLSYGELLQLKSSIEFNHSKMNSNELSNLMANYVEIVQENYELEAECVILTERIKKETKRRQNEISTSNQIAELFDFTSMPINIPEITKSTNLSKDNFLKAEISQLQKKLEDIKREQMKNDVQLTPVNIVCEATGSYARKAEAEWQVRSIGLNILRAQIKNLQKQVIDSTYYTNKIEETVISEKKKLEITKINTSEALSKAKSNNDTNKLSFDDELNQMDQTILQIKKDIERSIKKYDNTMRDINDLFEESRKYFTLGGSESNDNESDDEDDSTNYVCNGNNVSEINVLINKKCILEKEVNDLKKKYLAQKASIKKKESILKQKVSNLSNLYINNKKLLSAQTKLYISNKGNPIEKEMSSLINHIDSTILELRSTYA